MNGKVNCRVADLECSSRIHGVLAQRCLHDARCLEGRKPSNTNCGRAGGSLRWFCVFHRRSSIVSGREWKVRCTTTKRTKERRVNCTTIGRWQCGHLSLQGMHPLHISRALNTPKGRTVSRPPRCTSKQTTVIASSHGVIFFFLF